MSKDKFTYILETAFNVTDSVTLSVGENARLCELYTPKNLKYHSKEEIVSSIDRIKQLFSKGIEGHPTLTWIRIISYRSDAKPYIWMSRYDLKLRDNVVTISECVYNELPS